MLYQPDKSLGASCTYSASYYRKAGKFYEKGPKVGDQIFFKSGSEIVHTGIVVDVDSKKVYTVEGNTSGASGVVANGGCVCRKAYSLTDSKIAGYGRPNYALAGENQGAKVNLTTGTTKTETVQVSVQVLKQGMKGNSVKKLQILLNGLGHNCGKVDGSFGPATLSAVKSFQKAVGITVDGSVGKVTWGKLLS